MRIHSSLQSTFIFFFLHDLINIPLNLCCVYICIQCTCFIQISSVSFAVRIIWIWSVNLHILWPFKQNWLSFKLWVLCIQISSNRPTSWHVILDHTHHRNITVFILAEVFPFSWTSFHWFLLVLNLWSYCSLLNACCLSKLFLILIITETTCSCSLILLFDFLVNWCGLSSTKIWIHRVVDKTWRTLST